MDPHTEVLLRPNEGFSYASWNHAYDTYRAKFDHYILVEDDYMPCAHNFDTTLVEMADDSNGYVCGMVSKPSVRRWPGIKSHAANSNGVIRSDIWGRVHPAEVVTGDGMFAGPDSQVLWSASFEKAGVPLTDWIDSYASPFWRGQNVEWCGKPRQQALFMPIQASGKDSVPIRVGRQMLSGSISDMGVLQIGGRR
jgi:hypothetical protein